MQEVRVIKSHQTYPAPRFCVRIAGGRQIFPGDSSNERERARERKHRTEEWFENLCDAAWEN